METSHAPHVPAELLTACLHLLDDSPLLLGIDFDGVLAPLVDDPAQAVARPGSLANVRELARHPGVTVALISGRALADLARQSSLVPHESLIFVGSHGAEFGTDPGPKVDAQAAHLLVDVRARLDRIAAHHPGTRLEHKPTASVLHTRRAETAETARTATAAALAELSALDGIHLISGKDVVEAAVTQANKGMAVQRLRDRLGPRSRVIFLGDDLTDETVFRRLEPPDVGIKVGPGPTVAQFRLLDPLAVEAFLTELRGAVRRNSALP
ncbi:MAG: trehalose-phosphatase [Angustibacter sp.]